MSYYMDIESWKELCNEMDVLEKLAQKANSGPWIHDGKGNVDSHDHEAFSYIAQNCSKENADYIAAANPKMVVKLISALKYFKIMSEMKQENKNS